MHVDIEITPTEYSGTPSKYKWIRLQPYMLIQLDIYLIKFEPHLFWVKAKVKIVRPASQSS